jgi:hypothetical protein
MPPNPRALLAALLVLLVPAPGGAGQLMIEHFGLVDVAAQGQPVYVATVKAARPHNKRSQALELQVTAVYPPGSDYPKVGQTEKVTTYGGVEWTDEHKSMRERRLRGTIDSVTVGMRVVAVMGRHGGIYSLRGATQPVAVVDLLAADAPTLRTVGVLFDPAQRAAYPKEPLERLNADLQNPELAAMAASELQKSGRLTTLALLEAEERWLYTYYRALKPEQQLTFATEAAAAVEKKPALRDRAIEQIFERPLPGMIPAVARLARTLDPNKDDDKHKLEDLRGALFTLDEEAKGKRLDFTPLQDFLLLCEMSCPARRDEEPLKRLTRHLSKAARTRLAVGMLENAYTHSKPEEGPDETLLEEAARLAAEAPDPSILVALAKVDPTRSKFTQTKEDTMGAMIRVARAIMKALPASAPKARAVIDGWIAKGAELSDEDRKRWRHGR